LNKGEYTQNVTKEDGKFIIKYLDGEGKVDETYKPELSVVSVEEIIGISNIKNFVNNYSFDSDMINELIFAFSTDPGSLNSFNGYVIKIGDKNSSWVPEFQKDGAIVLGEAKGYLRVTATDYGYHFIFSNGLVQDYSEQNGGLEQYSKDVDGIDNLENFFDDMISNWLDLDKDVKDTYIYSLANTYLQNILSNYETELERIKINDGSVTKFESRYADLIG
ncbi:MAG: hypothetical protein KBS91_04450, partial [Firmicutes bacterium]|nr:hypothetical protein [Candidatus Caballimonas caccae]